MYLHKDVSDHIERTFRPQPRAVLLASLVTEGREVQEIGVFRQDGKEVTRLDIVHVKVRICGESRTDEQIDTRSLNLYVGALHVATLTKVRVAGKLRYEVRRGPHAKLRFDIIREPVGWPLALVAA